MILQFFVPSLYEIGPVVMGEVIKVTSLFPIQLPPMKDCTMYTKLKFPSSTNVFAKLGMSVPGEEDENLSK